MHEQPCVQIQEQQEQFRGLSLSDFYREAAKVDAILSELFEAGTMAIAELDGLRDIVGQITGRAPHRFETEEDIIDFWIQVTQTGKDAASVKLELAQVFRRYATQLKGFELEGGLPHIHFFASETGDSPPARPHAETWDYDPADSQGSSTNTQQARNAVIAKARKDKS